MKKVFSVEILSQVYTLQYNDEGELLRVYRNDSICLEWLSIDGNSIKVRYTDSNAKEVVYTIETSGKQIRRINDGNSNVYDPKYVNDSLRSAYNSTNCFYGIYFVFVSSITMYNFNQVDYGYSYDLEYISHESPMTPQDTIHVGCKIYKSEQKSKVPMPMQSLRQFGYWFEDQRAESLLLYFLSLRGYYVWKEDQRLTDKWLFTIEDWEVEDGLFSKFEYESNINGEITKMSYHDDANLLGNFAFQYY